MIAPLYIDNIWKITWDFFGNFQTLWPSEIQKSWEWMERGNTVYSIPIRFLKTGKFIVTDCSLESRKIHMEKVCLVPSAVEMKGSSKLYCFNRYTQGNANFCSNYCYHTDSLFRSLKIISSLLKIERHHPQRDWGISSDGSFFIIHHFQFMSFAFFPSLHSVEKKNWLNFSIISTKMIFLF